MSFSDQESFQQGIALLNTDQLPMAVASFSQVVDSSSASAELKASAQFHRRFAYYKGGRGDLAACDWLAVRDNHASPSMQSMAHTALGRLEAELTLKQADLDLAEGRIDAAVTRYCQILDQQDGHDFDRAMVAVTLLGLPNLPEKVRSRAQAVNDRVFSSSITETPTPVQYRSRLKVILRFVWLTTLFAIVGTLIFLPIGIIFGIATGSQTDLFPVMLCGTILGAIIGFCRAWNEHRSQSAP